MKKYLLFEKIFSFVPVLSYLLIIPSTMVVLAKNKVKANKWFHFGLIFFASGISYSLLRFLIPDDTHLVWGYILHWCIYTPACLLFVALQRNTENEGAVITDLEKKTDATPKDDNMEIAPKAAQVKMLVIGIVIVSVIFLVTIGAFVTAKIFTMLSIHKEMTIPDTNGIDNYDLATITVSDIVNAPEKNTMLGFSVGGEGEPSLVDETSLTEQDQDIRRISASAFSGVKTLQATRTASDTLTLTVNSEVSEGNFAIIVIVDGEFHSNIDIHGTQTVELSDIANKTVILRIAGESAKISVEVSRNY